MSDFINSIVNGIDSDIDRLQTAVTKLQDAKEALVGPTATKNATKNVAKRKYKKRKPKTGEILEISAKDAADIFIPVKRGPGRPRKNPTITAAPKRKPGRPRKNPVS